MVSNQDNNKRSINQNENEVVSQIVKKLDSLDDKDASVDQTTSFRTSYYNKMLDSPSVTEKLLCSPQGFYELYHKSANQQLGKVDLLYPVMSFWNAHWTEEKKAEIINTLVEQLLLLTRTKHGVESIHEIFNRLSTVSWNDTRLQSWISGLGDASQNMLKGEQLKRVANQFHRRLRSAFLSKVAQCELDVSQSNLDDLLVIYSFSENKTLDDLTAKLGRSQHLGSSKTTIFCVGDNFASKQVYVAKKGTSMQEPFAMDLSEHTSLLSLGSNRRTSEGRVLRSELTIRKQRQFDDLVSVVARRLDILHLSVKEAGDQTPEKLFVSPSFNSLRTTLQNAEDAAISAESVLNAKCMMEKVFFEPTQWPQFYGHTEAEFLSKFFVTAWLAISQNSKTLKVQKFILEMEEADNTKTIRDIFAAFHEQKNSVEFLTLLGEEIAKNDDLLNKLFFSPEGLLELSEDKDNRDCFMDVFSTYVWPKLTAIQQFEKMEQLVLVLIRVHTKNQVEIAKVRELVTFIKQINNVSVDGNARKADVARKFSEQFIQWSPSVEGDSSIIALLNSTYSLSENIPGQGCENLCAFKVSFRNTLESLLRNDGVFEVADKVVATLRYALSKMTKQEILLISKDVLKRFYNTLAPEVALRKIINILLACRLRDDDVVLNFFANDFSFSDDDRKFLVEQLLLKLDGQQEKIWDCTSLNAIRFVSAQIDKVGPSCLNETGRSTINQLLKDYSSKPVKDAGWEEGKADRLFTRDSVSSSPSRSSIVTASSKNDAPKKGFFSALGFSSQASETPSPQPKRKASFWGTPSMDEKNVSNVSLLGDEVSPEFFEDSQEKNFVHTLLISSLKNSTVEQRAAILTSYGLDKAFELWILATNDDGVSLDEKMNAWFLANDVQEIDDNRVDRMVKMLTMTTLPVQQYLWNYVQHYYTENETHLTFSMAEKLVNALIHQDPRDDARIMAVIALLAGLVYNHKDGISAAPSALLTTLKELLGDFSNDSSICKKWIDSIFLFPEESGRRQHFCLLFKFMEAFTEDNAKSAVLSHVKNKLSSEILNEFIAEAVRVQKYEVARAIVRQFPLPTESVTNSVWSNVSVLQCLNNKASFSNVGIFLGIAKVDATKLKNYINQLSSLSGETFHFSAPTFLAAVLLKNPHSGLPSGFFSQVFESWTDDNKEAFFTALFSSQQTAFKIVSDHIPGELAQGIVSLSNAKLKNIAFKLQLKRQSGEKEIALSEGGTAVREALKVHLFSTMAGSATNEEKVERCASYKIIYGDEAFEQLVAARLSSAEVLSSEWRLFLSNVLQANVAHWKQIFFTARTSEAKKEAAEKLLKHQEVTEFETTYLDQLMDAIGEDRLFLSTEEKKRLAATILTRVACGEFGDVRNSITMHLDKVSSAEYEAFLCDSDFSVGDVDTVGRHMLCDRLSKTLLAMFVRDGEEALQKFATEDTFAHGYLRTLTCWLSFESSANVKTLVSLMRTLSQHERQALRVAMNEKALPSSEEETAQLFYNVILSFDDVDLDISLVNVLHVHYYVNSSSMTLDMVNMLAIAHFNKTVDALSESVAHGTLLGQWYIDAFIQGKAEQYRYILDIVTTKNDVQWQQNFLAAFFENPEENLSILANEESATIRSNMIWIILANSVALELILKADPTSQSAFFETILQDDVWINSEKLQTIPQDALDALVRFIYDNEAKYGEKIKEKMHPAVTNQAIVASGRLKLATAMLRCKAVTAHGEGAERSGSRDFALTGLGTVLTEIIASSDPGDAEDFRGSQVMSVVDLPHDVRMELVSLCMSGEIQTDSLDKVARVFCADFSDQNDVSVMQYAENIALCSHVLNSLSEDIVNAALREDIKQWLEYDIKNALRLFATENNDVAAWVLFEKAVNVLYQLNPAEISASLSDAIGDLLSVVEITGAPKTLLSSTQLNWLLAYMLPVEEKVFADHYTETELTVIVPRLANFVEECAKKYDDAGLAVANAICYKINIRELYVVLFERLFTGASVAPDKLAVHPINNEKLHPGWIEVETSRGKGNRLVELTVAGATQASAMENWKGLNGMIENIVDRGQEHGFEREIKRTVIFGLVGGFGEIIRANRKIELLKFFSTMDAKERAQLIQDIHSIMVDYPYAAPVLLLLLDVQLQVGSMDEMQDTMDKFLSLQLNWVLSSDERAAFLTRLVQKIVSTKAFDLLNEFIGHLDDALLPCMIQQLVSALTQEGLASWFSEVPWLETLLVNHLSLLELPVAELLLQRFLDKASRVDEEDKDAAVYKAFLAEKPENREVLYAFLTQSDNLNLAMLEKASLRSVKGFILSCLLEDYHVSPVSQQAKTLYETLFAPKWLTATLSVNYDANAVIDKAKEIHQHFQDVAAYLASGGSEQRDANKDVQIKAFGHLLQEYANAIKTVEDAYATLHVGDVSVANAWHLLRNTLWKEYALFLQHTATDLNVDTRILIGELEEETCLALLDRSLYGKAAHQRLCVHPDVTNYEGIATNFKAEWFENKLGIDPTQRLSLDQDVLYVAYLENKTEEIEEKKWVVVGQCLKAKKNASDPDPEKFVVFCADIFSTEREPAVRFLFDSSSDMHATDLVKIPHTLDELDEKTRENLRATFNKLTRESKNPAQASAVLRGNQLATLVASDVVSDELYSACQQDVLDGLDACFHSESEDYRECSAQFAEDIVARAQIETDESTFRGNVLLACYKHNVLEQYPAFTQQIYEGMATKDVPHNVEETKERLRILMRAIQNINYVADINEYRGAGRPSLTFGHFMTAIEAYGLAVMDDTIARAKDTARESKKVVEKFKRETSKPAAFTYKHVLKLDYVALYVFVDDNWFALDGDRLDKDQKNRLDKLLNQIEENGMTSEMFIAQLNELTIEFKQINKADSVGAMIIAKTSIKGEKPLLAVTLISGSQLSDTYIVDDVPVSRDANWAFYRQARLQQLEAVHESNLERLMRYRRHDMDNTLSGVIENLRQDIATLRQSGQPKNIEMANKAETVLAGYLVEGLQDRNSAWAASEEFLRSFNMFGAEGAEKVCATLEKTFSTQHFVRRMIEKSQIAAQTLYVNRGGKLIPVATVEADSSQLHWMESASAMTFQSEAFKRGRERSAIELRLKQMNECGVKRHKIYGNLHTDAELVVSDDTLRGLQHDEVKELFVVEHLDLSTLAQTDITRLTNALHLTEKQVKNLSDIDRLTLAKRKLTLDQGLQHGLIGSSHGVQLKPTEVLRDAKGNPVGYLGEDCATLQVDSLFAPTICGHVLGMTPLSQLKAMCKKDMTAVDVFVFNAIKRGALSEFFDTFMWTDETLREQDAELMGLTAGKAAVYVAEKQALLAERFVAVIYLRGKDGLTLSKEDCATLVRYYSTETLLAMLDDTTHISDTNRKTLLMEMLQVASHVAYFTEKSNAVDLYNYLKASVLSHSDVNDLLKNISTAHPYADRLLKQIISAAYVTQNDYSARSNVAVLLQQLRIMDFPPALLRAFATDLAKCTNGKEIVKAILKQPENLAGLNVGRFNVLTKGWSDVDRQDLLSAFLGQAGVLDDPRCAESLLTLYRGLGERHFWKVLHEEFPANHPEREKLMDVLFSSIDMRAELVRHQAFDRNTLWKLFKNDVAEVSEYLKTCFGAEGTISRYQFFTPRDIERLIKGAYSDLSGQDQEQIELFLADWVLIHMSKAHNVLENRAIDRAKMFGSSVPTKIEPEFLTEAEAKERGLTFVETTKMYALTAVDPDAEARIKTEQSDEECAYTPTLTSYMVVMPEYVDEEKDPLDEILEARDAGVDDVYSYKTIARVIGNGNFKNALTTKYPLKTSALENILDGAERDLNCLWKRNADGVEQFSYDAATMDFAPSLKKKFRDSTFFVESVIDYCLTDPKFGPKGNGITDLWFKTLRSYIGVLGEPNVTENLSAEYAAKRLLDKVSRIEATLVRLGDMGSPYLENAFSAYTEEQTLWLFADVYESAKSCDPEYKGKIQAKVRDIFMKLFRMEPTEFVKFLSEKRDRQPIRTAIIEIIGLEKELASGRTNIVRNSEIKSDQRTRLAVGAGLVAAGGTVGFTAGFLSSFSFKEAGKTAGKYAVYGMVAGVAYNILGWMKDTTKRVYYAVKDLTVARKLGISMEQLDQLKMADQHYKFEKSEKAFSRVERNAVLDPSMFWFLGGNYIRAAWQWARAGVGFPSETKSAFGVYCALLERNQSEVYITDSVTSSVHAKRETEWTMNIGDAEENIPKKTNWFGPKREPQKQMVVDTKGKSVTVFEKKKRDGVVYYEYIRIVDGKKEPFYYKDANFKDVEFSVELTHDQMNALIKSLRPEATGNVGVDFVGGCKLSDDQKIGNVYLELETLVNNHKKDTLISHDERRKPGHYFVTPPKTEKAAMPKGDDLGAVAGAAANDKTWSGYMSLKQDVELIALDDSDDIVMVGSEAEYKKSNGAWSLSSFINFCYGRSSFTPEERIKHMQDTNATFLSLRVAGEEIATQTFTQVWGTLQSLMLKDSELPTSVTQPLQKTLNNALIRQTVAVKNKLETFNFSKKADLEQLQHLLLSIINTAERLILSGVKESDALDTVKALFKAIDAKLPKETMLSSMKTAIIYYGSHVPEQLLIARLESVKENLLGRIAVAENKKEDSAKLAFMYTELLRVYQSMENQYERLKACCPENDRYNKALIALQDGIKTANAKIKEFKHVPLPAERLIDQLSKTAKKLEDEINVAGDEYEKLKLNDVLDDDTEAELVRRSDELVSNSKSLVTIYQQMKGKYQQLSQDYPGNQEYQNEIEMLATKITTASELMERYKYVPVVMADADLIPEVQADEIPDDDMRPRDYSIAEPTDIRDSIVLTVKDTFQAGHMGRGIYSHSPLDAKARQTAEEVNNPIAVSMRTHV